MDLDNGGGGGGGRWGLFWFQWSLSLKWRWWASFFSFTASADWSYCPRVDHSCVYRNQDLIFLDDFGDYISPTYCHGYRKETSHWTFLLTLTLLWRCFFLQSSSSVCVFNLKWKRVFCLWGSSSRCRLVVIRPSQRFPLTGGTCRFRSVADVWTCFSDRWWSVHQKVMGWMKMRSTFLCFWWFSFSEEPHLSLISTVCVLPATGGGKSRPLSRLLWILHPWKN